MLIVLRETNCETHVCLPLLHRYNTETVSAEVLSRMKQQMSDVNSTSSHSFLLDDDATLPFSAADVLNAMDDRVSDCDNHVQGKCRVLEAEQHGAAAKMGPCHKAVTMQRCYLPSLALPAKCPTLTKLTVPLHVGPEHGHTCARGVERRRLLLLGEGAQD